MPLNARRPVRRMRGGAQSHLVEADDGNFYIVKFLNNPQHRRILVNEAIAATLLRYLQLSTPDTALIQISPEFLREFPEVYLQFGTARVAVEPGWHFGSKHPGDPATMAVYDFLPDALLSQVANQHEFCGMLAFDKWAANADGRQAIFFRAHLKNWLADGGAHPRKMGFVALMIDHGFIFNGPHWDFPSSPMQGLYARKLVYDRVRSLEDFAPWLQRIVHLPEEVIDKAYRELPPEWIEGDEEHIERILEQLMRRRAQVPDMILETQRSRNNPFAGWT